MTNNFQAMQMTLIGILILSTFLVALAVAYKKRLLVTWGKALAKEPDQDPAGLSAHQYAKAAAELLPPLIDRPIVEEEFEMEEDDYYEEGDDIRYELVDDDDLSLLKTAEAIVGEIQSVVNHIASRPANPDEVCSKIHFVLRDMSYLITTEYYDAINSFVAVTVKRDCDLELTKDDIEALWPAATVA